jgi:Coenzyme PQQ synthesis protein D (PqqD)
MSEISIDTQKYLCNPDVVLREEDEDGGLLFNPDTNQVKVVNTTGLFIWKQFASPNQPEPVAAAILQNFEDAPAEVILADLKEFLDEMIQTGFIGVVE